MICISVVVVITWIYVYVKFHRTQCKAMGAGGLLYANYTTINLTWEGRERQAWDPNLSVFGAEGWEGTSGGEWEGQGGRQDPKSQWGAQAEARGCLRQGRWGGNPASTMNPAIVGALGESEKNGSCRGRMSSFKKKSWQWRVSKDNPFKEFTLNKHSEMEK